MSFAHVVLAPCRLGHLRQTDGASSSYPHRQAPEQRAFSRPRSPASAVALYVPPSQRRERELREASDRRSRPQPARVPNAAWRERAQRHLDCVVGRTKREGGRGYRCIRTGDESQAASTLTHRGCANMAKGAKRDRADLYGEGRSSLSPCRHPCPLCPLLWPPLPPPSSLPCPSQRSQGRVSPLAQARPRRRVGALARGFLVGSLPPSPLSPCSFTPLSPLVLPPSVSPVLLPSSLPPCPLPTLLTLGA